MLGLHKISKDMMLIGGAHVLLPLMKFYSPFLFLGRAWFFFPLLGHLKALCEGRVREHVRFM